MLTSTGRQSGKFFWLIPALALVFLMPTEQSLWIDESTTARYARLDTAGDFAERLLAETNSDSQFPLGNFYYWIGSRVTGTSEIGLRSLSAAWIAVAIVVLWRVGIRTAVPYLALLFSCHAFVWYYAGEARPYAMQIALGSGLLYALVVVLGSPRETSRGLTALAVCAPLLCATCMLGVIPVALVSAILVAVLVHRGWRPPARDRLKILIAGGVLILLGCYFAWTLLQGRGAETVGTWGVGLKNFVYSAYELLGYLGFGPGRYALRELALAGGLTGAFSGFSWQGAAGVVLLSCLYGWGVVRLILSSRREGAVDPRLVWTSGGIVAASFVVLFILSRAADFPFWGRHLAPVFPFLIFGVAGAIGGRARFGSTRLVVPLVLCAVLLTSSLMVRFHPDHRRDDYRYAAHVAKSAIGDKRVVWWSASNNPAEYYGLTKCGTPPTAEERCVEGAVNLTADELTELPPPDVIFVSKPDLNDRTGAVRKYIEDEGFGLVDRAQAFEVFSRSRP